MSAVSHSDFDYQCLSSGSIAPVQNDMVRLSRDIPDEESTDQKIARLGQTLRHTKCEWCVREYVLYRLEFPCSHDMTMGMCNVMCSWGISACICIHVPIATPVPAVAVGCGYCCVSTTLSSAIPRFWDFRNQRRREMAIVEMVEELTAEHKPFLDNHLPRTIRAIVFAYLEKVSTDQEWKARFTKVLRHYTLLPPRLNL